MLKIGIIVGSTRPGRKAAAVAKWVHEILKSRKDAEFEIVDIEDYKLPLLDEPVPPIMHQYGKPHTKVWSEKIASLDSYIFITPEYNHATLAALKNAIDFLFHEWNNKAAGFCRIWWCWRRPSSGELAASDGRNQGRGRTGAGGALHVDGFRELHDL
jgi:NAD(P)H-dependent FMN reductase